MLENRQQVVDDFALQNRPQLAEDFNKAYFDAINECNITYCQDVEFRLHPVGDSAISVNHLQRADEFGILFSIPWSHHEYILTFPYALAAVFINSLNDERNIKQMPFF